MENNTQQNNQNNQGQGYKDPIIQKLIDVLEEFGPPELKGRYYHGDVLVPAKSDLPMVSISRDRTRITQASDLEDDNIMPLVINVLYDYTRDLTNDWNVQAGITSLWRLMEQRNPDNFGLMEGTIAHVLRQKQQLGPKLWLAVGPNEVLDIDYGLGIERRGPGIFSVEAVARISARVHSPRPGVPTV